LIGQIHPLEAKMRDLRVNTGSIPLQVREYEHEGEAIIFLHFGGANLMMWQRAVPYFQDHYHLVLADLRDHGKSDKPQAGDDIDVMAEDIAGMMEAMKIKQAHVVGSSLGAEVGLSLAANYPDNVVSLVCEGALTSEYGPYGLWEGSEEAFKEHVAEEMAQVRNRADPVFPSAAAFVEARKAALEKYGLWNEYMQAMIEYDAYEVSPGQFRRSLSTQALVNYLEHYYAYRFEDYYRRVRCPVLMVPDEEELQNEGYKTAMLGLSQLVQDCKIVAVPGWNHPYGWLMEPEGMCKAVLGFLKSIEEG
jgi:pimeloyl-ACP methyl ester carboxylesterase